MEFEQQQILTQHYSANYKGKWKNDSPDQSRVSMCRNIINTLSEIESTTGNVLNIGSGPQSLEKQLLSLYPNEQKVLTQFRYTTLDVAEIPAHKLLARSRGVTHTRASGLALPYPKNSFDLVVSNHAIDFLPEQALSEAFRVLNSKGHAIFYFHSPKMLPEDLSQIKDPAVRKFWTYLREQDVLYKSEGQIKSTLESKGFCVNSVKNNQDHSDRWWEVIAQKV